MKRKPLVKSADYSEKKIALHVFPQDDLNEGLGFCILILCTGEAGVKLQPLQSSEENGVEPSGAPLFLSIDNWKSFKDGLRWLEAEMMKEGLLKKKQT